MVMCSLSPFPMGQHIRISHLVDFSILMQTYCTTTTTTLPRKAEDHSQIKNIHFPISRIMFPVMQSDLLFIMFF
jgi:hypothetical protein